MLLVIAVDGDHPQGMDVGKLGGGDPLQQAVFTVVVHQEPDRAAVHAVDGAAIGQVAMQDLQHETVAAQRYDDIGLVLGHSAIARFQAALGLLGLGPIAGDHGDAEGGGGPAHAGAQSPSAQAKSNSRRV